MSENHDEPTLDDVLPVHETAVPDHHEHAKTPKHPDEDDLAERTEEERQERDADQDQQN